MNKLCEDKIDFSIGPNNKETHDEVIDILSKHNYIELKDISYNGDHYSEILVHGDYNKFHPIISKVEGVSLEHWED